MSLPLGTRGVYYSIKGKGHCCHDAGLAGPNLEEKKKKPLEQWKTSREGITLGWHYRGREENKSDVQPILREVSAQGERPRLFHCRDGLMEHPCQPSLAREGTHGF